MHFIQEAYMSHAYVAQLHGMHDMHDLTFDSPPSICMPCMFMHASLFNTPLYQASCKLQSEYLQSSIFSRQAADCPILSWLQTIQSAQANAINNHHMDATRLFIGGQCLACHSSGLMF